MGIFDKLKGMVGSDDLDYNEYEGDLFGDDNAANDNSAASQQNTGMNSGANAYQNNGNTTYQNNSGYDPQQNNSGYDPQQNYGTYEQPRQDTRQREQQRPQENTKNTSGFGNPTLELKVLKVDRYDMGNQIADHLLNRRSVVLNLEGASKEVARRLLDYLGGVVYSIDGNLKRVANNTFILTPSDVDISGDQMRNAEAPKAKEKDNNDFFGDI